MSLVSLALRVAVARCLRGRTFAGERVYDSSITPIDMTVTEERRPFIVVTSDQERAHVTGRDVLATDREIDLVLELALASFVAKDDGIEILIPHTDEGMEVALDLMVRQVLRALTEGDTLWSNVFLNFVLRIERIEQRRGAGSENGVRFAARQILLVCDTIADPPFGASADGDGPWGLFLEALTQDPGTASLRPLVEDAIAGDGLTTWDITRTQLGLSRPEAAGIALIPLDDTAEVDADAEILGEVIVESDRDQVTISSSTASEQMPDV